MSLLKVSRKIFFKITTAIDLRDVYSLSLSCTKFQKIINPRIHLYKKVDLIKKDRQNYLSSNTNISSVPIEIMEHIFSFLDRNSLGRMSGVSTIYKEILRDKHRFMYNEAKFQLYEEQKAMYDYVTTSTQDCLAVQSIPGSGKTTIQLMLALDKVSKGEHSLIIIPPKVMNTWIDEVEKFNIFHLNPEKSQVIVFHGNYKKHVKFACEKGTLGKVVVTTPYYVHQLYQWNTFTSSFASLDTSIRIELCDILNIWMGNSFGYKPKIITENTELSGPNGSYTKISKYINFTSKKRVISYPKLNFIFDESHTQKNLVTDMYNSIRSTRIKGQRMYLFSASKPTNLPIVIRDFSNIKDTKSTYAILDMVPEEKKEIYTQILAYQKVVIFSSEKSDDMFIRVKKEIKDRGHEHDILVVKFETTRVTPFHKFRDYPGKSILCCNYGSSTEGLNFNMADCGVLENFNTLKTDTSRQCLYRLSRRNNVHEKVKVLWEKPTECVEYVRCKLNIMHATGSFKSSEKKTAKDILAISNILTQNGLDYKTISDVELYIIFSYSDCASITEDLLKNVSMSTPLLINLAMYINLK
jgi:hypothetical protein